MLFNSYIFIFVFLPIVLVGYFAINATGRYGLGRVFLLAMSLWFYGYYNPKYLLIIGASVLVNYGIYRLIKKRQNEAAEKIKTAKPVMILGVAINLGLLFYFKYVDFFLENLNALAGTDIAFLNIALPLGISFFTFQQISFIVDTYRGQVGDYDILTYACYVTFFPQLVAGPIVTHDELIPQLMDPGKKKVDWDNMAKGLYVFAIGLGKKVLLADVFGVAVNWAFENVADLGATNAILAALGYTFQLYFDFSGYCDMAIGLGLMLNLLLPVNFDSPYKSYDMNEFWNRWHITLGRFFTRYVYIPLGGNRRGNVRTYINLFVVFLLSGFWHGASWTFVIWGLLNGVLCIINRIFKEFFKNMHAGLAWMINFVYASLAFVFFRANTVGDAIELIKQILYVDFTTISVDILDAFKTPVLKFLLDGTAVTNSLPYIYVGIYYFLAFYIIMGCKNSKEKMESFKAGPCSLAFTAVLLVASILSFAGISTFLYFNF